MLHIIYMEITWEGLILNICRFYIFCILIHILSICIIKLNLKSYIIYLFIFDDPRFSWRQQMVTCVRSEMSTLIFFIPAIQILNSNQKFACDINVHMTLHSGPHYIW